MLVQEAVVTVLQEGKFISNEGPNKLGFIEDILLGT